MLLRVQELTPMWLTQPGHMFCVSLAVGAPVSARFEGSAGRLGDTTFLSNFVTIQSL